MPLRRYFRVSSRNLRSRFEGWMPHRRGCHSRGRALRRATGRVVAVAGLLLSAPASAQTLTEAFAYAYNNNPQLLAQRALLRSTDEGVPQALSNWRPTVSFTGSAGVTRARFEQPGRNPPANFSTACPAPPLPAARS